MFIDRK